MFNATETCGYCGNILLSDSPVSLSLSWRYIVIDSVLFLLHSRPSVSPYAVNKILYLSVIYWIQTSSYLLQAHL